MKNKTYVYTLLIFSFLVLFGTIDKLYAQSSTVTFGQNRVQFHGFEWSFYETDHFNTYFYIGNQEIGKFVILDAEKEFKEISNLFDMPIKSKIDILVYTDITDANMTNIGIYQEDQNVGGNIKIIENKLFVYFDGNHNHLREQIRQGIAHIFIQRISLGTNFQEVMQNVVSPNIPVWFSEGLEQYISKGWTPSDDNLFKTGIEKGQYVKFKKLDGEPLKFFGKAFWNFVKNQYGEEAISNLLYIIRVNPKNINSAFSYALGSTMNEMLNKCMKYYVTRYAPINENTDLLLKNDIVNIHTKKNTTYYQVDVSKDGNYLAYCSDEFGRKKVYVYDIKLKKTKAILRIGHRTRTLLTDKSYPLIAWQPDAPALSIIYERRDKIKLLTQNIKTKKKVVKPITKFQKIYSMHYGSDNETLLFSALQKGQCDIFSYDTKTTNVLQYTNDFWDDLDPVFIHTDLYKGIVFKSNRRSDTIRTEKLVKELPLGPMNLFFYSPLYTPQYYAQITNQSIWSDVYSVNDFNDSFFSFISNESGIANRYVAKFESNFWYTGKMVFYTDTFENFSDSIFIHEDQVIDSFMDMSAIRVDSSYTMPVYKLVGTTFPISNSNNSILEERIDLEKLKVAAWHFDGIRYKLYYSTIDTSRATMSNAKPYQVNYNNKVIDTTLKDEILGLEYQDGFSDTTETIQLNTTNATSTNTGVKKFQNEFDYIISNPTQDSIIQFTIRKNLLYSTNGSVSNMGGTFKFSKQRPYIVKMMADKLAAQLDNTLLVTRYAVFNPTNPTPNMPALGGLFKLGVVDLMENYRITGGFRIPSSFSGTEYFLSYENLKKRMDVKYTYYRSSKPFRTENPYVPFDTTVLDISSLPFEYKVKTNYAEVQLKYPIDVLQCVKMGIGYRNDKYVYKAVNEQTLALSNYATNWASLKLEYVFDNTFNISTNIRRGTRLKLFTEWHKEIPMADTKISSSFSMKLPRWNNAYFGIIGADIRHYEKLYRNIILATRFSWSTSVGTRKMIYYLGGVDGGVAPKFNTTTPINDQYNYAFQSLATDMRGFDQNIRNGNSYALINAEIRIPVFSGLFNLNSRSELIKNFQLVGFTDVGTAWEGLSPFTNENPLFKNVIRDPITSPITVTIYQKRNPVVSGFGAGLRTTIFGYFIRADVAWGYDGAKITSPKLHFSFNLDF